MKILFFDDFKLGVLEGGAVIEVSQTVRDIPHTGPHDLWTYQPVSRSTISGNTSGKSGSRSATITWRR